MTFLYESVSVIVVVARTCSVLKKLRRRKKQQLKTSSKQCMYIVYVLYVDVIVNWLTGYLYLIDLTVHVLFRDVLCRSI